MSKSVIKVKNLCKSYTIGGQNIEILKALNFQMDKGSFVAIRGASGMGKSTFLNIIGALDSFDMGEVEVAGCRLDTIKQQDDLYLYRRSKVGFIFQEHYLLPDFTILENTILPLLLNGYSKKNAIAKALDYLSKIGLEQRITHYPNQISGGESQRVAALRAIIHEPDIILADEPTGNLDSMNSKKFIDILSNLSHTLNLSILVVTHDTELSNMADISYNMVDGQIVSI